MATDEIEALVKNLAPNSALEVAGDVDAVRALIAKSERCLFERVNGEVIFVWGFVTPSFVDNTAVVWCLYTNKAKDHAFTFYRRSRIMVEELKRDHPAIRCYVKTQFNLRWLKLAGFRPVHKFNDYWELEYHGN